MNRAHFMLPVAILLIIIGSCQRPYLNPDKESAISPVYTGGFNYKRQHFQDAPLQPPFRLIQDIGMRGQIASPPCLIGNFLYTTTYDGYLCKIDIEELDETANYKVCGGIKAAPSYFDRFLFIAGEVGKYGLYAYDILEAKILWEKPGMLSASSAVAAKNMVFHASLDGWIRAFNTEKGEEIWSTSGGGKIVSDMAYNSQKLYVATENGKMLCLDASSGGVIWRQTLSGVLRTAPVLAGNNIVLIATYQGTLFLLNSETGKVLKKMEMQSPLYYSPSTDEKNFYLPLGNGDIYCWDMANRTIAWKTSLQGPASAPVLVTRDYLFIGTTRGFFYCLAKDNGNIIQQFTLEGRPRSTPVVVDGKLIFGQEYARFAALVPAVGEGHE